MPGTRRRLSADVRREQILETASELFTQRGFESVKMADIAEKLHTSRPNIYTYFASTEAILNTLFERRTTEYVADLKRTLAENPGVSISKILGLLLEHRELLLLMSSGGGPSFREQRQKVRTMLEEQTQAYLPPEYSAPEYAKKVRNAMMLQDIATLSVAYEIAANPSEYDVEEIGELLAVMVTNSYAQAFPELPGKLEERARRLTSGQGQTLPQAD